MALWRVLTALCLRRRGTLEGEEGHVAMTKATCIHTVHISPLLRLSIAAILVPVATYSR